MTLQHICDMCGKNIQSMDILGYVMIKGKDKKDYCYSCGTKLWNMKKK